MVTITELKTLTQSEKRSKAASLQRIGYLWHRNISVYITYFLLRVFPRVTPNFVSAVMILLGLYGAWLVSSVAVWVQLTGVVLVYVSFLLDKVDGEIARYKNLNSLRGAYLDEWYHDLVPGALLVSFFIAYAYEIGIPTLLLLMTAVYLTLFRRYERKWYIIIAWKRSQLIESGSMMVPIKSRLVDFITQNVVIKATAVVERFDIFLAITLLVIVLRSVFLIDWTIHFLWAYTVLSVLYTVRFALHNYFGGYDVKVANLLSK